MRGWLVAAVCAAGWAATCWEARRRWAEDGKALEAARLGLAAGYRWTETPDSNLFNVDRQIIARAATLVGAALEARS